MPRGLVAMARSGGHCPLRVSGGILCSERGQSRDAFQAIPLEETSPRCNNIILYGTSCIDAFVESLLGITTDLYHNIFFQHHDTHSNKSMALLFPSLSYLKSNSALKASRYNLSRNSFVWLFLLSSHERIGICPYLVLVF